MFSVEWRKHQFIHYIPSTRADENVQSKTAFFKATRFLQRKNDGSDAIKSYLGLPRRFASEVPMFSGKITDSATKIKNAIT